MILQIFSYYSFYLLFIFCIYYLYSNYNKKPKGFQKKKLNKHIINKGDIDKDRYSYRKIEDNIDIIIIGSGIGSLTCAGLLSRVGKKVLVLEQHYIAGGCMHSFEEKEVEHETGIHYIGKVNKSQKILNLITNEPIQWYKMGSNNKSIKTPKDTYDEIYIDNKRYCFRAGEDNFINDLSIIFPKEKKNIEKYVKLVKKVASYSIFFHMKIIQSEILVYMLKLYLKYFDKEFYKYINSSTYNIISQITNNDELISVLCGQFGDYGIPPKKSNFFIHASVVNHYLEGGYFPKGGTSIIPKKIISFIEKSGGRVLVGKKVKKILIENNKVNGVEMENGDKIKAPIVVSGVGINNTFNHLIENITPNIEKYVSLNEKIGPSTSFIYCFVNLEGTPDELELRDSNLWIYPSNKYEEVIDNFEEDILNNPMPFFISSGSAKDKSWCERYPDKSSAVILTMAKKEWFLEWENEKCTNRNIEYKELKEKLGRRMLNEGLFKYYPKTKGTVLHYEVATPLSNQFYLGTQYGEGYGLNSSEERFNEMGLDLKPETPIKNLYLTGQDICTFGFAGALMGGVLTTHSILGYGSLLDIITNRNLINDIIKHENKYKNK